MYEMIYEYLLLAALVGAELTASGGKVTEAGFMLRSSAITAEAEVVRAGLGDEAGIVYGSLDSPWD